MADKEKRITLKGFFESGDIPEAKHFEALIDSGVNQMDDGLRKSEGTPLEIQAPQVASAGSFQDVIRLYDTFASPDPWRIGFSAASAGLSISADKDKSYLFIETGNGNIGIGTTTPGAQLEVVGGLKLSGNSGTIVSEGTGASVFKGNVSIGTAGAPGVALDVTGNIKLSGHIEASGGGNSIFNGNVGIGANPPQAKLDVNGPILISNGLVPMGLTTEVSRLLNLDVNFRHSTKDDTARGAAFRVDTRNSWPLFQWLKRSAGQGEEAILMVLHEDGKVGIGKSAPGAMLDVNGTAKATAFEGDGARLANLNADNIRSGKLSAEFLPEITTISRINSNLTVTGDVTGHSFEGLIKPTAGNTDAAGILFPSDPGGGSGDKAWIRYFARPGTEKTILEIGVANDVAGNEVSDHIALMSSGNVGIGTYTPAAKLDVIGDVKATSFTGAGAGLTGLNAGNITSGLLPEARMANLSAEKITSGTLHRDRLPADIKVSRISNDLTVTGKIFGNSFSGLIKPTAGNSTSDGIIFPEDPGGGIEDRAWIRYYVRSGQSTTLEIGISNNSDDHIALMSSGNVGIGTLAPTHLLSVNGSASKPGGGNWSGFSDKRIKKDIESFTDGLNVVSRLRPVRFRYNGAAGYPEDGKQYVGIIGQEVREIAPYMIEIVQKQLYETDVEPTDLLMYDSSALSYILVNAMQEQQRMIERQQLEIKKLSGQLSKLAAQINAGVA